MFPIATCANTAKKLTVGLNRYSFSIIFTPSNILLYILKFLARFSFWKFKYLSKERSTTVVFNLTNLTQKILYFYRTLHNNSLSHPVVYRPYIWYNICMIEQLDMLHKSFHILLQINDKEGNDLVDMIGQNSHKQLKFVAI